MHDGPALAAVAQQTGVLSVGEVQLLQLRLDTNSFCEGLFPAASFFNHSCQPVCEGEVADDGTLELHTVGPVPAGAPLTISYLDALERYRPTDQRRAQLLQKYHFLCQCPRCCEPIDRPLEGILTQLPCGHDCMVPADDVYLCTTCRTALPAPPEADALLEQAYAVMVQVSRLAAPEAAGLALQSLSDVAGRLVDTHWLRFAFACLYVNNTPDTTPEALVG